MIDNGPQTWEMAESTTEINGHTTQTLTIQKGDANVQVFVSPKLDNHAYLDVPSPVVRDSDTDEILGWRHRPAVGDQTCIQYRESLEENEVNDPDGEFPEQWWTEGAVGLFYGVESVAMVMEPSDGVIVPLARHDAVGPNPHPLPVIARSLGEAVEVWLEALRLGAYQPGGHGYAHELASAMEVADGGQMLLA